LTGAGAAAPSGVGEAVGVGVDVGVAVAVGVAIDIGVGVGVAAGVGAGAGAAVEVGGGVVTGCGSGPATDAGVAADFGCGAATGCRSGCARGSGAGSCCRLRSTAGFGATSGPASGSEIDAGAGLTSWGSAFASTEVPGTGVGSTAPGVACETTGASGRPGGEAGEEGSGLSKASGATVAASVDADPSASRDGSSAASWRLSTSAFCDFFLLKNLNIRFTLPEYLNQTARPRPRMKKHVVRIVGGDYRKTPIPVIDAAGLRPTPDRVRETLFNWLHHFWGGTFEGKRVLDLFAGTGALGFEAASRGVAHVQMVESNPVAVTALRALRNRLDATQVRIHQGDARQVLKRLNEAPFDLVMLDPPFEKGWVEALWEYMPPVLRKDGLLYIESEAPVVEPDNFERLRTSKAGHVHFQLFRFAATQKTDNNPASDSISL
jgi:16S rRNA (guanine966-N2)-methyltransferase